MYIKQKKRFNVVLLGVIFVLLGIYYFFFLWNTEHLLERNIVLSPHYDDAVLSLGGTIAHNKNNVIVATFFTKNSLVNKETSWDKLSGFSNSLQSTLERSIENRNASILLGAQEINYPYVDFQYRTGDESKTIHEGLVASIKSLINENKSFKLNIYGPASFGDSINHPDHKLLHDAFMEVAKDGARDSQLSFFMYEDFPYIQIYNDKNTMDLKLFTQGSEQVKLVSTPVVLSYSDSALKEQALMEYKSQIKAFNNVGQDLVGENKLFTVGRCRTTPCEMTYKVIFPRK